MNDESTCSNLQILFLHRTFSSRLHPSGQQQRAWLYRRHRVDSRYYCIGSSLFFHGGFFWRPGVTPLSSLLRGASPVRRFRTVSLCVSSRRVATGGARRTRPDPFRRPRRTRRRSDTDTSAAAVMRYIRHARTRTFMVARVDAGTYFASRGVHAVW